MYTLYVLGHSGVQSFLLLDFNYNPKIVTSQTLTEHLQFVWPYVRCRFVQNEGKDTIANWTLNDFYS